MPTYYDDFSAWATSPRTRTGTSRTSATARSSARRRATFRSRRPSAYLRDVADVLRLDEGELGPPARPGTGPDAGRGPAREYQLDEDKTMFDSTTVSFAQTFFDVPVFRRGISVELKHGPNRIVGVTNNTEPDLAGELPSQERIDVYRKPLRRRRRVARTAWTPTRRGCSASVPGRGGRGRSDGAADPRSGRPLDAR